MSAKEYVHGKISRKIDRALNNKYPGGDVKGCYEQQSLANTYLIPELDGSPYTLIHGDLSPNNIIVDSEYNVKGYVKF